MKSTIIFASLIIAAVFGLSACPGGTNTNTANMNRSTNSNTALTNANNSMINNANINANRGAVVQDDFYTKAAQGGMAEVELGKLALQKSQNAEVKKFAQTMITDHGKANSELKTLAAKKNVTLPAEVSSSQKSMMEDLSKLSGAEFDKKYVEAMVEDHETDVELFEDNTDNSDADIKAFATKTLPTLKSHLQMIKDIQSKMK
jgi:putative membrane protein